MASHRDPYSPWRIEVCDVRVLVSILGQIFVQNARAPAETILHIVSKFQLDRACFRTEVLV